LNLPFLLETAAYDLCTLLERVATSDPGPVHDALLEVFLDVDREPDSSEQEASLRGVRKAQLKLATWYLESGDVERARRIFDDMRAEPISRLVSIRGELEAVLEPDYWEVSDRGVHFDWMPIERRRRLAEFFSWFNSDEMR
jgi:pentatricopeptide repeat protein